MTASIRNSLRRHHPWEIARFVRRLPATARLYARLFGDRRVSAFAKALLVAGSVYALTPMDFLNDLIPLLGQMDDLALFALACRTFLGLCPNAVVEEHATAIEGSQRAALGA